MARYKELTNKEKNKKLMSRINYVKKEYDLFEKYCNEVGLSIQNESDEIREQIHCKVSSDLRENILSVMSGGIPEDNKEKHGYDAHHKENKLPMEIKATGNTRDAYITNDPRPDLLEVYVKDNAIIAFGSFRDGILLYVASFYINENIEVLNHMRKSFNDQIERNVKRVHLSLPVHLIKKCTLHYRCEDLVFLKKETKKTIHKLLFTENYKKSETIINITEDIDDGTYLSNFY